MTRCRWGCEEGCGSAWACPCAQGTFGHRQRQAPGEGRVKMPGSRRPRPTAPWNQPCPPFIWDLQPPELSMPVRAPGQCFQQTNTRIVNCYSYFFSPLFKLYLIDVKKLFNKWKTSNIHKTRQGLQWVPVYAPFTQLESTGGQLASCYPHQFLYPHTTLKRISDIAKWVTICKRLRLLLKTEAVPHSSREN